MGLVVRKNLIHYQYCEAPICQEDLEPEFASERVWYAGEPICPKRPFRKFQLIQSKINQLVKKGINVEGYFTIPDLEKIKRIRIGFRGRNPD